MDNRLDPLDTALMVVDVQVKLLGAMTENAASTLVKNVSNLVHGARQLGVPVLFTEQYPKGLGSTVPQVAEALKEAGATGPLVKDTFSALRQAEVLPALDTTRKRRVLVCGMEAHICVYLTARDLMEEGFQTHVAHDACLSRREADRAVALELMRQSGAFITSTETALFEWLQSAAHPAFKDISRRIR
jgi:nicotinamidase-related amidase